MAEPSIHSNAATFVCAWTVAITFASGKNLLAQCATHNGNSGTICCEPVGADVIVGIIQSSTNFQAEPIEQQFVDAFSFGYTVCNIGSANLLWQYPSTNHPAGAQSLFRLKGGRLEQVGASWVQHKITVLAANPCGCGCNGVAGSMLGVGCGDPESAGQAAFQTVLTPRWEVNAFSGTFLSPAHGAANPPFKGSTARRLRVSALDLEPSSNDVRYFAEWLFVSAQEASLGNQGNNSSHREVLITGGPDEFNATIFPSATVREQPAIRAWKASDPSVLETDIQVPGEGLFILAAKATHISGNVWNYEYALMNFNSDLSGRAFRVPLPPGAVVTNIGFHDVDYHSGDAVNNFNDPNLNISGQDWNVTITNDAIEWSTHTYAQNINANALRWGTMYNFRFNINRAPHNGDITLTTYKVDGEVNGWTVIPAPADCPADIAPFDRPDGTVNVADLLAIISAWGSCTPGNCPADVNGDATVNVADLLAVINGWGACQ